MTRQIRWRHLLAAVLLFLAGCGGRSAAPALDLPDRAADAKTGSEVLSELVGLSLEDREDHLTAEILAGNIPSSLRDLKPIEVRRRIGDDDRLLTFWVLPDYLAVGSEEDNVLVPLSYRTARRIAAAAGAVLPTPDLVDEIWHAAETTVAPIRLPPGDEMTTVDYFERHDRLIKAQRFLYRVRPGALVAGSKVDLVRIPSDRLPETGMAIYGWHQENGYPIQPLFTRDSDRRVAFNQGVRLVSRTVELDGERRDLLGDLGDY